MKRLSIVVPVKDEEESIAPFFETLIPHLGDSDLDYEIVFVNDGSSDSTLEAIRVCAERIGTVSVTVVDLSRNFGKEAALTAGLEQASGDAVIPMDVDLQDPPEIIPEMIARWRDGAEVVVAARKSREGDSLIKRATASGFYRLFNALGERSIPVNVGDFRLMSREVIEAVLSMPERVRFNKGVFAWAGYKTSVIEYERSERHAGRSKWNYPRLARFAMDGITSFSTAPLKIATYCGLAIAFLSFLYGAALLGKIVITGRDLPGYASIMLATLFLGGAQLFFIGVLGEYVGRIFVEVKQRPLYFVRDVFNFGRGQDRG